MTGDICIKLGNIRTYFQKRDALTNVTVIHDSVVQLYYAFWVEQLGFVAGTIQLNGEFFFLFELIS